MSKLNFFQLTVGNYCTAYEIGAKVKELTQNPRFFLNMNSDGQERIGRWVNAEVGKIYKLDARHILDGTDAISLPYESNKYILDTLVRFEHFDSGWFVRHGKLDMYSLRIAEMIIRSFTGINEYSIYDDVVLHISYCKDNVNVIHNDISKKYVHRKQRNLRTPGHKSLF